MKPQSPLGALSVLSRELRDQIYRNLYPENFRLLDLQYRSSPPYEPPALYINSRGDFVYAFSSMPPENMALLLASKILYHEVSEILFGETTFHCRLPLFNEEAVISPRPGQAFLNNISRIEVVINVHEHGSYCFYGFDTRRNLFPYLYFLGGIFQPLDPSGPLRGKKFLKLTLESLTMSPQNGRTTCRPLLTMLSKLTAFHSVVIKIEQDRSFSRRIRTEYFRDAEFDIFQEIMDNLCRELKENLGDGIKTLMPVEGVDCEQWGSLEFKPYDHWVQKRKEGAERR